MARIGPAILVGAGAVVGFWFSWPLALLGLLLAIGAAFRGPWAQLSFLASLVFTAAATPYWPIGLLALAIPWRFAWVPPRGLFLLGFAGLAMLLFFTPQLESYAASDSFLRVALLLGFLGVLVGFSVPQSIFGARLGSR